MSKKALERTSIVALILVAALSSAIMVWLFWRHPLATAIATLAIWAAFGISARLARSMDTESLAGGIADLERGKHE